MTQNLKFKSVRIIKVAFTAIATSILSIGLVYAQKLQNPKEHNTKVYAVSFSPDGKLLASGSGDGTVKLWDAVIGKELNTLKGHSDKISSVSFSPDGKTIASASADKTIRIWNLDGSLTKVLRRHDAEVTNISFCPDNQIIVSSSADNTISLWKLDGKLVKTLTVGGSIRNVDCSPDSKIITVTSDDNIVRLWNRNGQQLQTFNFSSLGSRGKISFVPHDKDGNVISVATGVQGNGGNLSINTKSLILKDGDIISAATGVQRNSGNLSINASDTISVDGMGSDAISSYKSSSVEYHSVKIAGNINFNARSLLAKKIASPIVEYKTISLNNRDSLLFVNYKENRNNADKTISSNDNSIVASIIAGNIVLLSKNGSLLNSLKFNKRCSAIAFHPNNNILASGCDDGTINFWNVSTGKLIRSLKVHESKVNKVDYSPDGQRITSASDDGIVKIWYPDSSSSKPGFTVVIVSLVFVFSGITVLFFVTKRRQSKRHNNTSNTQSSYIITGWVVCVIPEDWRSDLEALRYELITAKNPTWYVRFITVTTLVDMLFGGIRVKLHNFYYGNNFMAVPGRPSITDKKDNSVNHNDLNE